MGRAFAPGKRTARADSPRLASMNIDALIDRLHRETEALKDALRDTVKELQQLRQELNAGRAGVNHEFIARARAREDAARE